MDVQVRPVVWADRDWARGRLTQHWGSMEIIARGRTHDASRLPGLLAEHEGEPVGLVTYHLAHRQCEVVTLNSFLADHSVGTLLLEAVRDKAAREGCERVWLVVTNDNTRALRFYQRRGWNPVALHRDAITTARKVKPDIPERGVDGIPIRHEIELELPL